MSLLYQLPPDLFRWFLTAYLCKPLHTLLVCLFVDKRFNNIVKTSSQYKEWIKLRRIISPTPLETVIAANEVAVLKWMEKKWIFFTKCTNMWRYVGKYGTLQDLYENISLFPYNAEVILGAAEGDQVEILERYRQRCFIRGLEKKSIEDKRNIISPTSLLYLALGNGAINVFKWLDDKFPTLLEKCRQKGTSRLVEGSAISMLRYLWTDPRIAWKHLAYPIFQSKDIPLNLLLLDRMAESPKNMDIGLHALREAGPIAPALCSLDSPEMLELYAKRLSMIDISTITEELLVRLDASLLCRHLGYRPQTAHAFSRHLRTAIRRQDKEILAWLGETHDPSCQKLIAEISVDELNNILRPSYLHERLQKAWIETYKDDYVVLRCAVDRSRLFWKKH